MGRTFAATESGRPAGWALAAIPLLAACNSGPFAGGDDTGDGADTALAAAAPDGALVERDVEAPEVFQVTENGLWDGRPSLGGVWVAHPDVTNPERVIIRNTTNGQFVIGALFRRERDNPGPALQVSSDAAEALGMLAGAPAELNVTALRREEAPAEPTPTAELPLPDPALGETTDLAAATDITATPLDPIAGAAAAIDAAEAEAGGAVEVPVAEAVTLETPPPPAPAASDLERPFIQIGIFSVRANADGAAADFDAMGLPARVVEGTTQGAAFWRVLVGPATTEAERAGFLDRVKAAGFADAYFTRS